MSAVLLAFTDFEATGIDTAKDVILEGYFDVRLVDPEKGILLEPVLQRHVYIDSEYDRSAMHPVAEQMHVDNGLWDDLAANADSALKVGDFDAEFAPLIAEAKDRFDGALVHLAGMGVANYDKRLIERDMPLMNQSLHYCCMDVSILRRFAKLAGWTPPERYAQVFGTVTHRAKGDVEQGMAQYRVLSRELARLNLFDNKMSAI